MRLHARCCADRSNFYGKYGRLSIFQDGGRPPSWICFTCIWTTHEEHLLVEEEEEEEEEEKEEHEFLGVFDVFLK